MKLTTVLGMAQTGRLRTLHALLGLFPDFYRVLFLRSAASSGLLRRLDGAAAPLEEVASALGVAATEQPALEAWLEVGERLGLLSRHDGQWALAGHLPRALAGAEQDDLLAMLEEVTGLHQKLLVEAPERLRRRRPFTLADQDGEVIARSSRVLEPLVHEALDAFVPSKGALRLLEVGCGSGTYARYALSRNPALRVLALELQPQVAEQARANLDRWGVGAQVEVRHGDLRHFRTDERFDLLTLHNNIYYFREDERPGLFQQLRALLAPGGRLLLTTACRHGSPAGALLDLWSAATEGCGRLPVPEELVELLRQAGFERPQAHSLAAPLEEFYAFTAHAP